MSIKYVRISVSIHGLDVTKADAFDWLVGWIREETKAGLLGSQSERFKFRNDMESDIEVKVEEIAGEDERKLIFNHNGFGVISID